MKSLPWPHAHNSSHLPPTHCVLGTRSGDHREGNGTPLQHSCLENPFFPQSMGSLRVRHNWATSLSLFTCMHWRRKWRPTPVFLPGESQGQGAWWAAVYGVSQSQTQLKRLSSSSSSSSGDRCALQIPVSRQLQRIPLATSCQPPSLPWLKSDVTQDNLDPPDPVTGQPLGRKTHPPHPNSGQLWKVISTWKFQMGLAEASGLQMGPTEAFVDSVSQDCAEREVGLLPSPPFSFPSPDSDPKSIPPKDTCMHICIPGNPTCDNVPCLCTPRTMQGF